MEGKYIIILLFGQLSTENLNKTLVSCSLYLVDSSCIPYLLISYAYFLWVMGHLYSFACSCALSFFCFPWKIRIWFVLLAASSCWVFSYSPSEC